MVGFSTCRIYQASPPQSHVKFFLSKKNASMGSWQKFLNHKDFIAHRKVSFTESRPILLPHRRKFAYPSLALPTGFFVRSKHQRSGHTGQLIQPDSGDSHMRMKVRWGICFACFVRGDCQIGKMPASSSGLKAFFYPLKDMTTVPLGSEYRRDQAELL